MTPFECEREDEVAAAIDTGRWPDRVDADLRTHVAECAVCQDVAAVAAAFREDVEWPSRQALPDAQIVWLRAQIRARADAARLAERPITVAQALAFAAVVGVLGALLGASSSWLQSGLRAAGAAASRLDPRGFHLPDDAVALLTGHVGIVSLLAVAVMAMPAVVYWAMREN